MRKNVISLTVDLLRADSIGKWNEEFKNVIPEIDKFADEGIVFKNAFSHSSHTPCSFASLFTSKYPSSDIYPVLKADYVTIAEILKNEGYTTIGIHSNPFLSRPFGYKKGSEILEDSVYPWKLEILPKKIHLLLSKIFRFIRMQPYLPAKEINKRIFKWIDKIPSPFFLRVHYIDVHGPYQSKKGFSYWNKIKGEILWHKAVKSPLIRREGKKRKKLITADTTLDDEYPHVCIRKDKWKLIINENIRKYELYATEEAPQEKNSYETRKEKAVELKRLWKNIILLRIRRLKDLGYF